MAKQTAEQIRRAFAALVVVAEAQQGRGQAVPAFAVDLSDIIRFEIPPREEVPTPEVAAPVFVKLRHASIESVPSPESVIGGASALGELVRWLDGDDTRRDFLHAGAPFARTWWRDVARWAAMKPRVSPPPSLTDLASNGASGPNFTWSTTLHFARRLFECLEWHWIETGQPRRRANRAALAVAGVLLDVEPDSVRKLAYPPSRRSAEHTPRHAPRTGLHLGPQLDGEEAEHLRQLGHALTAMLDVELRMLAAEVGPCVFADRVESAITEAKAEQLTLPTWVTGSPNYRQIR